MADGFNQNTNQPSGAYNGDFSGQLNDMLAPYQSMAQKFSSPYATMNQNSWLAKNHPQVAGILDNAFLTAGSTPSAQGPEGVGGGIARTMQGLMGGQQFQRQRMMQQAMLPYQMMQPKLQAMDTMAQIQGRQSEYMRAQDYHEMITNRWGQGGIESQKLDVAQQRADQAKYGRQLSDPMERMAHDLHPFKDPQNPTPEEYKAVQKEYMGMKEQAQRTPAGSYEEQIFGWRNSPDPAIKAMGDKAYADHIETLRAGAGARTRAEQEVTQPVKDVDTLVKQERQAAYATLEKPKEILDYGLAGTYDHTKYPDLKSAYGAYVKGLQANKQQMDVDLSKYERSTAPASKISFQEYMQHRDLYDGSAPNPAPVTPQSSPSGSGSTWFPKK